MMDTDAKSIETVIFLFYMVITWYGHACFKIQSGDTVLVVDPFAKEIGLTPPRFRADVVLVTHAHADHANAAAIGGEPFLISGPGEYEIKGINVLGLETFHDENGGRERGKNTIYRITVEGITILHMGDFGEREVRDVTLEGIGDIGVLMIPVGGKYTIDGERAEKIVRQIEPGFVIPMHYQLPGLKYGLDNVDAFLKEMGASKGDAVDKLMIKEKDVAEDKKTEVVVLKPVHA